MAEKIKIAFLGTGSAVPTKDRNHPSVLLKYKESDYLFDCGEGTQRQFRKARLSPQKIKKIFISHWHGDHVLGIPGLLQTLAMNGYNGTIEIHGPAYTKKNVNAMIELFMKTYLYESKQEGYNFKIEAFEHKSGKVFENDEVLISCFPLYHKPQTIGYSFEIKEKKRINKEKLKKLKIPSSPLIAELLKGKDIVVDKKKLKAKDLTYIENGRKVCYVLDTAYHKQIASHLKDSDILIIESTFLEDEKENAEKKLHLTAAQAGKIARESKTKKLVLTHSSQRYEKVPKLLKQEAKQTFKGEIISPKDLDTLEL